ncbi:MAG: GNAT family N-acetyltransferase [Thalassobaculum sp.]|uniref:GNAT family N-acetyltransferase n=1 Tax=Thalassobaculum sp. TaxID=2022740 RepID=UPI0032EC4B3A
MSIDLVAWPAGDVERLEAWVAAPHVARWWRPSSTAAVISALRTGGDMPDWGRPWRIDLDGRAIGFALDYAITRDGDVWQNEEGVGPGTRGIDLLIGEPDAVNRKHGRAAMRALATRLFDGPGVDRLVADPHPDNWPAIIAFKRAGFRERGRRQFPSGPVMVLTAAKAVWKA